MKKYFYVALLRGINVGGNNKVPMAELRLCVEKAGFENVTTYIQSGNVLFSSKSTDPPAMTGILEAGIEKHFGLKIAVVIMSHDLLRQAIKNAPKKWGNDPDRKHNLLFVRPPLSAGDAIKEMGTLQPEFEEITAGNGVVYWSASLKDFGKTASSRMASKPVYQQVTVRNYNTSVKLLSLLDALAAV